MEESDIIEYFTERLEHNLTKTRHVSFPEGMNESTQRRIYFMEQVYRRSAEEAVRDVIREYVNG